MHAKETIKELFFNEPTKQWHFEQVRKTSGLSRAQTNAWLKKLQKEQLITRLKPRKKMPYFIANHASAHFRNAKKLFALTKLYESGLLDYLTSLENAKTVILFGSFSRGDWYRESDVDLFLYGDIDQLGLGPYLSKLQREIQIFSGKQEEDLRHLGASLLRNILKGMVLKGDIPLEVLKHAAV
ncbi:MAG TPA: nucleotidyltransferase domain-containing protein [Candidatus Nanoarchaeia archaeon]|nr:nucleotidyltransferase domain-containing protein [Candidatus Nanoarchaeia archaeon]